MGSNISVLDKESYCKEFNGLPMEHSVHGMGSYAFSYF